MLADMGWVTASFSLYIRTMKEQKLIIIVIIYIGKFYIETLD